MPSLLVISFVEWAGAFQRPQHLALEFARRGWNVTYASPGYLHRRSGRVDSGVSLPATLRVIEPPALPGASRLAPIESLNRLLMTRRLRSVSRSVSVSASPNVSSPAAATAGWDAVIFNDPRFAAVAGSLPARLRVFDCMDDLSLSAPDADLAREQERRALAVADLVWTGTPSLKDKLEAAGTPARFIAGGVEADRFAHPDPAAIERARGELAKRWPSAKSDAPLAGYFGALNERLDPALIQALLDENWRVLLIGPATSRAPRLPSSPNLLSLGPRPYAELPAWLALMDLALIPYDVTGPHRFLYPVKALEYLAGGKPVLSSPLPDVQRLLGDYVLMAESPDDWRRIAREWPSLAPDALARTERGRAYALTRSWSAMADEMESDLLGKLQGATTASQSAG